MARQQREETFDHELRLKTAGAVTASGNAQVDGEDAVLDLGEGRYDSRAIVDTTACKTSGGDESYEIRVQLSNSATFASGVVTAVALKLGHQSVTGSTAASPAVARYELPFCNEVSGSLYRYARLAHAIAGTSPSISYSAFAVKKA